MPRNPIAQLILDCLITPNLAEINNVTALASLLDADPHRLPPNQDPVESHFWRNDNDLAQSFDPYRRIISLELAANTWQWLMNNSLPIWANGFKYKNGDRKNENRNQTQIY